MILIQNLKMSLLRDFIMIGYDYVAWSIDGVGADLASALGIIMKPELHGMTRERATARVAPTLSKNIASSDEVFCDCF